jgi:hypothetical protein
LKREYVKEHGLQFGTDAAKGMLKQADAKLWIAMKSTTAGGKPKMPEAVKQYARRLGDGGLDYRAIRVMRTEQAGMLADEQTDIARNSAVCSGDMEFVLARGRDHWNCSCEDYEGTVWNVADPGRPSIPVHPNCACEWRPVLKTDEEVMRDLYKTSREPLETLHGKEWVDERIAGAEAAVAEAVLPKVIPQVIPPIYNMADSEYDAYYEKNIEPKLNVEKQTAIKKMSADEIRYTRNYTGTASDSYNAILRGNAHNPDLGTKKEQESAIRDIVHGLNQFELKEPIKTFRREDAFITQDWEVGRTYGRPEFISTSTTSTNKGFDGKMLEIRVPPGRFGAYVAEKKLAMMIDEKEFLLKPGLRYKVISNSGNDRIILEVIE